jgi:hypothetical protein
MVDAYSNIPLADLIRIAQYTGERATAKGWADLMLELNEVDLAEDLPEGQLRNLVAPLYAKGNRRTRPRQPPP